MNIRRYGIGWEHGPRVFRCHCTDPGGYDPEKRCVYAGLHTPRFARDADGWWLAPLLRIEIGYDHVEGWITEIPFIERTNGRTTIRLIARP